MIWNLIIGSRDSPTENGLETTTKRARSKKQAENDIDFTKNLEKEVTDLFVPPRNPKSLLLPKNRAPCNTKLPEDCHYQPEDLVKLFLLPNVKVNIVISLFVHMGASRVSLFLKFLWINYFGCSALGEREDNIQVLFL